jgi:RNA 3'-phosphate cyclase
MIELDGSQGEGGGQILRTSLALSLITGRAFHLRNLRARRDKPGLQPQHLMSVQAAATIGQASTRGAALRSRDLVFEPGRVQPGAYHFAIGTAGNTGLVLQTIYLPLALASAPSAIVIEGGTHVKASPCFQFLQTTWRAYLQHIGISIDLHMRRSGFYPRGGGLIEADIAPCPAVHGLRLDGIEPVRSVSGFSAVAGLPEHILHRQAQRAREGLEKLGLAVELREETWPGGPGTAVGIELPTAPAPTLVFALGQRGKPAEHVADEAVAQAAAFLAREPLGVDEHSADQIVLALVLAKEPSHFPVASVSSHLLTNVDVIARFIDRTIMLVGRKGEPGMVRMDESET